MTKKVLLCMWSLYATEIAFRLLACSGVGDLSGCSAGTII